MRCGMLPKPTSANSCGRLYFFSPSAHSTWVQEHRFEFDEAPSVEAVAAQLSRLALKFNGYDASGEQGEGGNQGGLAMSRPVGVALLMAGIDCGGRPVLYHLDPSGEAWVMAFKTIQAMLRLARFVRSCGIKIEYVRSTCKICRRVIQACHSARRKWFKCCAVISSFFANKKVVYLAIWDCCCSHINLSPQCMQSVVAGQAKETMERNIPCE